MIALGPQIISGSVTTSTFNSALLGLSGSAPGGAKTAAWTLAVGAGVALSLNGASTGAGGVDTGTLSALSTAYTTYAIYNATTSAWSTLTCLTSTSGSGTYTGSNMPSGYASVGKICAFVTDGNANIQKFYQVGDTVYYAVAGGVTVLSSTSPPTTPYDDLGVTSQLCFETP